MIFYQENIITGRQTAIVKIFGYDGVNSLVNGEQFYKSKKVFLSCDQM